MLSLSAATRNVGWVAPVLSSQASCPGCAAAARPCALVQRWSGAHTARGLFL